MKENIFLIMQLNHTKHPIVKTLSYDIASRAGSSDIFLPEPGEIL